MKSFGWISLLALVLIVASPALAGVMAYEGLSGEELFIESAPKLGKNAFVIQFSGVDSAWADKPIKVTKSTSSGGDRYAFDYDLELSDGIQKRTYTIVVGGKQTLVKGTLVPQVELHYQESTDKKPLVLTYDAKLTKASKKLGLVEKYEKTPFKPDVD